MAPQIAFLRYLLLQCEQIGPGGTMTKGRACGSITAAYIEALCQLTWAYLKALWTVLRL